jgi:lysophospholipase L1-like esterase
MDMNKLRLTVLCLLLFGCSSKPTAGVEKIVSGRFDTIRYAPEYYEKRVAEFQKEATAKNRIVFLGNSITEFGDWETLLNDSAVFNRGIAADNTFGVLDRLDNVIDLQPSKLFIEVGINDLSQGIPNEIIVNNLFKIVSLVRKGSPSTKIYVHGIFPTNDNVKKEYPDAFGKNALADQINQELIKNAELHSFTYIDIATPLKDTTGNLDIRYAESDGLHLNPEGYRLWVTIMKDKGYL